MSQTLEERAILLYDQLNEQLEAVKRLSQEASETAPQSRCANSLSEAAEHLLQCRAALYAAAQESS